MRSASKPIISPKRVIGGEGVIVAATHLDGSVNSLSARLVVALKIRRSRKWASPDLPGGSSALPTLYQTI